MSIEMISWEENIHRNFIINLLEKYVGKIVFKLTNPGSAVRWAV